MTRSSTIAATCLVAASLLLGAAGCSGGGSDGADASARSTTTRAKPSKVVVDPDRVSPKLDPVPELADPVGIRSDASLDGCTTTKGEVTASGKVANKAEDPADIVVVVSWINKTSDVVARASQAFEHVKPGDSADWSVKTKLALSEPDISCVLNVRRGTLR